MPWIVSGWTITTTMSARGCSAWIDEAQLSITCSPLLCRLSDSQELIVWCWLIMGRPMHIRADMMVNAQEQIQR